MVWNVEYTEDSPQRTTRSVSAPTRYSALDKACALLQQHFVVRRISGPNGEMIPDAYMDTLQRAIRAH